MTIRKQSTLPKILCGPMLRKTTKKSVNIWIALSEERKDIKVNIYTKSTAKDPLESKLAGGRTPVQMGKHLFLYLLRVSLSGSTEFAHDTPYFYDVLIGDDNLEDLGLVGGKDPITYGQQQRPSFFIPENHREIIQASCRKPHASIKAGKATVDMMRQADAILGENISNLSKRPSQLFLTGDQIYADDVALPAGIACSVLGKVLMGYSEILPAKTTNGRPIDPYKRKLSSRDSLLKRQGFTSSEKDNHLLTFGEFAAMYIFTFGGMNFGSFIPDYDEIKDKIESDPIEIAGVDLTSFLSGLIDPKEVDRDEYDDLTKVLKNFSKYSAATRRLMANVPTYMIFDDHDVTDDWNLTEDTHCRLTSKNMSRRIVTNALAAYWGFQSWGNAPDQFYSKSLSDLFRKFYASQDDQVIDGLEKMLVEDTYWGYVVEGSPCAIVLDTRTKREFHEDHRLSLISKAQLETWQGWKQADKCVSNDEDSNTLVLVSPTPVFGFKAIEVAQLAAGKDSAKRAAFVDREPWIANKDSIDILRDRIASLDGIDKVVILSGDVHYAYHRYEREYRAGRFIEYYQLTSSAACNMPVGGRMTRKALKAVGKSPLFDRYTSPYLEPLRSEPFITADTNVGKVTLDNSGPVRSVLYCADKTFKGYRLDFDLRDKKERESTGKP
ncbi:MAG: hypothetical protein MI867_15660 [Pseudomonadales bacterium]|nr:hypothetical protein [Pseudomonadales bacterium]